MFFALDHHSLLPIILHHLHSHPSAASVITCLPSPRQHHRRHTRSRCSHGTAWSRDPYHSILLHSLCHTTTAIAEIFGSSPPQTNTVHIGFLASRFAHHGILRRPQQQRHPDAPLACAATYLTHPSPCHRQSTNTTTSSIRRYPSPRPPGTRRRGVLAQNHDPEAQHAAGSAADPSASHELGSSGVHVSQASLGGPTAAGVSSLASSVASVDLSSTLTTFFDQPWVQRGTPEILYIKRAARIGDNWSAHVAFPGGRKEEGDENGLYTAMRETWEEVGIDLAEKEFSCVGQLDDREITTSLGKRLLMVLSPYVFVQTSPFSPLPDLQPSEVASAHWVPLTLLYTPRPKWGTTSVDISSRLAPKSPVVRWVLRALVGKMDFKCILLPNEPVAVAEYDEGEEEGLMVDASGMSGEKAGSHIARTEEGGSRPELRLWGLTLGMTLDLLSHMTTYQSNSSFRSGPLSPTTPSSPTRSSTLPVPPLQDASSSLPSASELVSSPLHSSNRILSRIRDEFHLNPPPASHALAPSLTSVFPRFSYPDVNFWIWFFGWRYRTVVRGWKAR